MDRRRTRRSGWLLAALLTAHVVLWAALLVPGHLLLDEGAYELAARAMAQGSGLEILNGYRERASLELAMYAPGFSYQLHPSGGRLVCQYPPGFGALGALPWRLAGPAGLIALNGAAVALIGALTLALSRRLGGAPWLALLLLFGGSYLWEYGLAILPHALAVALGLGALLAALRSQDEGAAVGREAALAGLLLGVGVTVRLDALLFGPAVAAASLAPWRPDRPRALAAGALGALPPLLALSWANAERFGTWSPLSYGVDSVDNAAHVSRTSGPGAFAGALVVALSLALLLEALRGSWPRWARWGGGALATLTLALSVDAALELGAGLWRIGVDLRWLHPSVDEPGMQRLPSGAVLYLGEFKKSWLQSCPWLVAAAAGLGGVVKRGPSALLRRPALLGALTLFLVFAAKSWHGGLGLNLRYLLPALPLVAIEASAALSTLPALASPSARSLAPLAPIALGMSGVALWAGGVPSAEPLAEHLFLEWPLFIALALGASLIWPRSARGERAATWAAAAALGWSAGVAWGVDMPIHRHHREAIRSLGVAVADHVEAPALVFAGIPDPLFALIPRQDVLLANTWPDGGEDLLPLATYHLGQGRSVYAVFPEDRWTELRLRAAREGVEWRPVAALGPHHLAQLRRTPVQDEP